MRNHFYLLPDPEPERGTGHHEEIKGAEEVEGEGNKDGSHLECRM
jgi:hypothetical protein